MKYNRYENESDEELIYRICSEKESIGSWEDVANVINGITGYEYTESKYRKQYQAFSKMLNANRSRFVDADSQLEDINEKIRELEKLRKKVQTEKIEYNRWLREDARDEMLYEKVMDSIATLPSLETPEVISVPKEGSKEYLLVIGDEHFGTEFSIKGLFGEVINEYSPEIYKQRMSLLMSRLVDVIDKEDIEHLRIFSMGDVIDGCLRVSQLMKLRYGVVDACIKYAEYMSNWLNTLSKFVKITFYNVHGNHSELRMLGQPKGTFKEDNLGKIVEEFISVRLADNPNFEFIKNPTGMIYENICGYNVLAIHGEVRDMENTLHRYSSIYNTKISYLFAGHLHHSRTEDVGIDTEVINVPSVIGCDDYSLSLQKLSNPAAKLFVFEEGIGKTIEYTIKLN